MRASWALVMLCCAGGCEPERPRAGAFLDADQPIVDVPPRDRVAVDLAPTPDAVVDDVTAGDVAAPPDGQDVDAGARAYPPGPYSGRIGEVFPPIAALTCDNVNYEIATTDYASSRATLVLIEPSWCACTDLERAAQNLYDAYRARGLRVVTFLVEGASPGELPSAVHCEQWVERLGLTHRVTYDTRVMVRRYFPSLMLPSVAITDGDGRVTFFASGLGVDPAAVRAQIAMQLGPAM